MSDSGPAPKGPEPAGPERSLSERVLSTTAVLAFSSGVVRLLSIATAPILTAALGPTPYGVVALAGTATSLLSTLSFLGLGTSYTRSSLSDLVGDRGGAERFCWRLATATAAACSALALGLWWLRAAGRLGIEPEVPLMVAIGVLIGNTSQLVSIRLTLRGAYRTLALAGVANGITVAATSIGIALGWRADAWALFLGTTCGTLVGVAVSRGIPWRLLARPSGLSRSEKTRILAFGAPTALTALMYWVVAASDRWFIALLSNEHELGVYSLAYNVGNLATLINSAVNQAWLPEVFRSFDRDPRAAHDAMGQAWGRTFLMLAMAWLFVTASGGDVIRLLTAPSFHEGAEYVPWIAGGIFFYGLYHPASSGLMLRNNLRAAAAWWLGGAVLTMILNYALIREMGAYGAAVSATVGFALISAGVLWSSQRLLHMPLPWSKMLAVGGITLIAGVLASRPWSASPLSSLASKLVPCAAVGALAFRIAWPSAWSAAWLRLRALVAPGRDRRR